MLTLTIHSVYSFGMNAEYTLLGFLEQGPNYGYELKKLYDNYFGGKKQILAGQIYSTLSRLERDGKVLALNSQNENSGGPKRIKYEATDLGMRDFEHWLLKPEAPAMQLQITMYVKTVFAIMKFGDASQYLDGQRSAHIEKMRSLTKERRESGMCRILQIDHEIFHLEADLRWIDLTVSKLGKIKEEICKR